MSRPSPAPAREGARMERVVVPIRRLANGAGRDLPAYATAHAAGADLIAALVSPVTIDPGRRAMIPTGIAIALPVGYEAQVRPRSGLAAKHGVTVLNAPGTIDADYRGEIQVILINFGDAPFVVEPNARIAQLIVAPVSQVEWDVAEALGETARGDSGFGSTGLGQIGV